MRRFGLIGRPLGHSASAAYFAAKFEREGIADCTYTPVSYTHLTLPTIYSV